MRKLSNVIAIIAVAVPIAASAQAAPDPCKYTITSPPINWTMNSTTGELVGTRSGYINLLDSQGGKVAKADGSVNFTEQQAAHSLMLQRMLAGCRKPQVSQYDTKFSWTPPTTRTNGDPLAASELAGYEIYVVDDMGGSVKIPVQAPAVSITVPLKEGWYSAAISTIDKGGLKSPISPTITFMAGPQ